MEEIVVINEDPFFEMDITVLDEGFVIKNNIINNVTQTVVTQIFYIATAVNIPTGALLDGVPKSVPHGITGYSKFGFVVSNSNTDVLTTLIEIDPANPLTNFVIQVDGVDLPAGLIVTVIPAN